MNYMKRHGVGDFLNHVFTIVPSLWKSALPVAAVAFLPAGLAYVMGFGAFGASMESLANLHESSGKEVLTAMAPFFGACGWLVGAAIVYSFAYALVNAMVTDQTISQIKDEPSDGQALRRALTHNALTLLGQGLIIACVMGTILLLFYGVAIGGVVLLFSHVANDWNSSTIGLVGVAMSFGLMLIALPLVYWFLTKISVAPQVSVAENVGGFVGIGRSFALVRGSSWRVFGITFLINLVIGFALGILTGPVMFIFVLPGYIEFIKGALNGSANSPEAMALLFKSMAWGVGVVFYLQSIAMGLLWPIYQSLLYTDLKIRRGEWQEVLPPPPAPPPTPVESTDSFNPTGADNHE